MNVDPLLARYLRQLRELGGPDLFLDAMDRAEALALMKQPRSSRSEGVAQAEAAPSVPSHENVAVLTQIPQRSATEEQRSRLTVLHQDVAGCTRCRLHATRTQTVFGVGNPAASLVVVGEAPGQEEDRKGEPFVGRAGKLLDLLLMSIGLPRDDVYICNVLKCRPPENRNPLPDEVDLCSSYLHEQLSVIAPRVLLAVGTFAAKALTNSEESVGRLRGRLHEYRGIPLVVSYHPAYLLRSPNMVRTAWTDFQLARTVLDEQQA